MKERLFIVLSLVLIIVALIGLNAASYAPLEKEPDTEERANRSTYNGGATGTRAFFEFLRETGRPVVRWQERATGLLDKTRFQQPKTFVLLDNIRQTGSAVSLETENAEIRKFEEQEIKDLFAWVRDGGRLVIVYRVPPSTIIPDSGSWQIAFNTTEKPPTGDSANINEMTKDVVAARVVQPSVLTSEVNSVMPSKFATSLGLFRRQQPNEEANATDVDEDSETETEKKVTIQDNESEDYEGDAPLAPKIIDKSVAPTTAAASSPVVLLANKNKNILADYRYGAGRVIFLSDPYIISNGGIGLVDNLKLASNLVGSNGLIAFDEYHQGYGASGNPLLTFFEGTPLPAIFAQLALLLVLAIYTKGRRFARPLPLPNPDRRSKLEYVGAMAELQRRTRAYDLAIENIYNRVRRNLARFAGVDNASTPPHVLAERIAMRSRLNKDQLTNLLRDCEDVIQGEVISGKQALALVTKLRETEQKLGLRQTNLKSKI